MGSFSKFKDVKFPYIRPALTVKIFLLEMIIESFSAIFEERIILELSNILTT